MPQKFAGILLTSLVATLIPTVGCKLAAAPFLLWGEHPTKTIVAEYPYLDNKRVCILVYTDMDTQFMRPSAAEEISDNVRVALEGILKGVTVVPTREVLVAQRAEKNWDRKPAQFGKRFNADRVLVLDVSLYKMSDPETPHLLRGNLSAYIKVYDTGQPEADAAYRGEVSTTYPAKTKADYGMDERSVRKLLLEAFAQDVAGKFYDRKVKIE